MAKHPLAKSIQRLCDLLERQPGKLRPVGVAPHQWHGWFHGFAGDRALVEDSTGAMHQVSATYIRFLDGKGRPQTTEGA